MAQDFLLVHVV